MPECYKITGLPNKTGEITNGKGYNNTATGINDVIGITGTPSVLLNGRMRQYFNSDCSVEYYVWMTCPEDKSYKFNNLGLIAAWMSSGMDADKWN
jgi:hypothetical protein